MAAPRHSGMVKAMAQAFKEVGVSIDAKVLDSVLKDLEPLGLFGTCGDGCKPGCKESCLDGCKSGNR